MKYNVLWLDDEFNGEMDNTYSFFLEAQKKGKYVSLNIERCTTSTEMKYLLDNNSQYYQAVILDVIGKIDDDHVADESSFQDIMDYLNRKDYIIKFYSGTLDSKGHFAKTYRIKGRVPVENQDYFDKIDVDAFDLLFETLERELNNKLNLYQSYPELLELFRKGYLLVEDKPRMDRLLEDFKAQNTDPSGKGYIRELLQGMMERLVYYGEEPEAKHLIIKDKIIKNKQEGRFGLLFKYLSYGNHFGGQRNRGKELLVSTDICPKPIKDAIQYIGNMANSLEHPNGPSGDVFDRPFYSTMMLGIYPTMIEILLWFYHHMND